MVVKTPVDSTTYSAPALPQGMALGSLSEKTAILLPITDTGFFQITNLVTINLSTFLYKLHSKEVHSLSTVVKSVLSANPSPSVDAISCREARRGIVWRVQVGVHSALKNRANKNPKEQNQCFQLCIVFSALNCWNWAFKILYWAKFYCRGILVFYK